MEVQTVTLATLIDAREALQRAYGLKIRDGRRVIQVRRTMRKINDELQAYGSAVDDHIQEHGITGAEYADRLGVPVDQLIRQHGPGVEKQKMIGPAMAEYADYQRYVMEMRSAEVDIEIPQCLQVDDFDEISAAEIDQLEAVGLLEVDEEAEIPEGD
jgi:hypothetical protein